MSKMMIVAATSEKMLELMDKITIEEGVISFLASNKATALSHSDILHIINISCQLLFTYHCDMLFRR